MNSDLLSSLLQKLTIENERVCLPGMGSFVMEDIPSVFLDGGKRITPPGRRVLFKSSQMLNDGRLETSYARTQGVTLPQAREMLLAAVKELMQELEEKGQAQLSGFGTFRSGEGGRYFFVADKDFNAAPDSFGLETLALKIKGDLSGEAESQGGKETSTNGNISGIREEKRADGLLPDEPAAVAAGIDSFPEERKQTVSGNVKADAGVAVRWEEHRKSETAQTGGAGAGAEEVIAVEGGDGAESTGGAVAAEQEISRVNVQADNTGTPAGLPGIYQENGPAAAGGTAGSGKTAKEKQPDGKQWVQTELSELSEMSGTAGNRQAGGEGPQAVCSGGAGPENKAAEVEKETVPPAVGAKTVGIQKEEKIQKTGSTGKEKKSAGFRVLRIVLCILGIFVIALLLIYIFRDSLHPLLEKILYSKEELEILRQSGRM